VHVCVHVRVCECVYVWLCFVRRTPNCVFNLCRWVGAPKDAEFVHLRSTLVDPTQAKIVNQIANIQVRVVLQDNTPCHACRNSKKNQSNHLVILPVNTGFCNYHTHTHTHTHTYNNMEEEP